MYVIINNAQNFRHKHDTTIRSSIVRDKMQQKALQQGVRLGRYGGAIFSRGIKHPHLKLTEAFMNEDDSQVVIICEIYKKKGKGEND